MRKMTEESLRSAFAGESQAHMRYLIFADVAEKENFKNVARLFKAIAYAEQVHATNHYRVLGMVRSTAENLQIAVDGETFEVNEMYPAYEAIARVQEERSAQKVINWALQTERVHKELYRLAKQSVESGKDIELGPIYVCSVCGYTSDKEFDKCPVCGASKDMVKVF
ncbi:MAG: rubrerythrin family protein [Candidatus Geothermarchaeota archaeon]